MGTKRSVLTDENGLPLAIVISGANTHDIKLPGETLDHIMVSRPKPDEKHPQNLCLDAGYTGSGKAVEQRDYIVHIRPRGEEEKELQRNPDFRARRWIIEVTHSFFDRFRKLPRKSNGCAFLHNNVVLKIFTGRKNGIYAQNSKNYTLVY